MPVIRSGSTHTQHTSLKICVSITPEVSPLVLTMGICKCTLYFHHSGILTSNLGRQVFG